MLLHGSIIEESHEDDDENLASSPLTWQEIAENRENFVIFESVIEEFHVAVPENEEDKLPEKLVKVANNILYISLGMKVSYSNLFLANLLFQPNHFFFALQSVKSHKEDFERLLSQATSLVVVFWQSYVREGIPGSMWPPPYLREPVDRLVEYVSGLSERYCERASTNYLFLARCTSFINL